MTNQTVIFPRAKFKKHFPNAHNVVVAIHAKSIQHALETADIAYKHGADGVAVVSHFLNPEKTIQCATAIKEKHPYNQVILNILSLHPADIFSGLQGMPIDGVWTDNALIPGVDVSEKSEEAGQIKNIQEDIGRDGLYFGGINFKGGVQTPEENLGYAVAQAKKYIDVVTTSGKGTGYSADPDKIAFLKTVTKDFPLGIASGITPENIMNYIKHLDMSFVMTGISLDTDKDSIDENKIKALMKKVEKYNTREHRRIYEAAVLEKYGVDNFIALQQKFNEGGVINITSGSNNELEKKLSNLYYSPFTLDGIEYASVEAFWMSIKYPQTDSRHIDIRKLSGLEAKKAGNDAKYIKSLQYNGHNVIVGSLFHHFLLKRAIKAKLEAHSEIAQLLKDSGDKEITHIPFYKDGLCIYSDSKTIPAETFARIIIEIRKELQGEEK